MKDILCAPHRVHYFDANLPTHLLTDTSTLHGLGYALMQSAKEGQKLIQCGSRSCTETERRYAPIEQECLAAVWAIQKCSHWLYGSPGFELITDHQPLVGIFRKELGEIPNRRLQRLSLIHI